LTGGVPSAKLRKKMTLPIPVKKITLSIILVTHNQQKALSSCLDSIYRNQCPPDFELIVVDNHSQPPISKYLKNKFPDIVWIENNRNLGYAKAVNQGIRISKGGYTLVLNSDTVLFRESLYVLVSFMHSHKRAAAAGGKILDSQGLVQPTCRRFPVYLNTLFNRSSILTRLLPKNRFSRRYLLTNWNHNNIRRVDWVCGAFIILRKEVLEKVGYFDESYFMYCEEMDWCWRAKKMGYKIYYVPEAKLIHKQNPDHYIKKIIQHHRSMYLFYKKHLKPGWLIRVSLATGALLKIFCLLLLYALGICFINLHKTLTVSNKSSNIKA
jgi:hypothetical protein